jgi:hypothetical protein
MNNIPNLYLTILERFDTESKLLQPRFKVLVFDNNLTRLLLIRNTLISKRLFFRTGNLLHLTILERFDTELKLLQVLFKVLFNLTGMFLTRNINIAK